MKTITVAARKGGAGKSTLAAHLSVLAEAGGARVLLIDTDPQGSLVFWWRLRKGGTPEMVQCKAGELSRIAARARLDRVAYCIIDTPPHSEPSILDAMRIADLVLIPTRPGPFDLDAVAATLALARKLRKTPLVVLNHTPPAAGWGTSAIVAEAREAVHGMGGDVAESYVTQRVALSHAIIGGLTVGEFEPAGKAAREVAALWKEIKSRLES